MVLSACGSRNDGATIDVSAAASLGPAFASIIEEFRAAHPEIDVLLNTAGSATLVTQIQQGSEADVVALADVAPMDELVASGDVQADDVEVFATNTLAILVAKGNPLGITSLADLATKKAITVMCEEAQPCGRSALEALEKAAAALTPASLENKVSGVVQKVEMGEADAGLAYVSDGRSRSATLDMVAIPDAQNVVNSYPIAVTSSGDDDARTFVAFVLGEGREILRESGFGEPTP
jgi:molybdate transport system substrate-binding protein